MSNFRPSLRGRKAARRRARRRRMLVRCAGVLLCAGALALAGWKIAGMFPAAPVAGALAAVQPTPTPAPTPTPSPTPEPLPTVALGPEEVSSSYALLARASDGKVIWSKGEPTDTVWPASITKVLTALVALEHLPDLDATYTMPLEIYQPLFDQNASMAGFWSGESPTIRDLLYGTLLPSGAEAATGLALAAAGDEATFVAWMNQKAADLGMTGSHFANVWGIYQEDHYSTPADLLLLMEAALQNDTLRTAMSTVTYTTGPLSAHPDGLTMVHSILAKEELAQAQGFLLEGGKTGFTDEAGLCLASFAQKGGEEFILITTGAMAAEDDNRPLHLLDAIAIYGALELP